MRAHTHATLVVAFAFACTLAQAATVVYTYDAAGRIATAAYDNGTMVTYTHDPAGNVLRVVAAAVGPAVPVTVVEFYNAALDHYFITWAPDEIAKLDAGVAIKGWVRTNLTFKAFIVAQAGTSPVCRFYIIPLLGDSHFFGRGTAECNATARNNPSFILEDPAFMHMFLPNAGVCPASTTPVYRVFSNRPDANHRYTSDRAVRDSMKAKGWLVEGDGPDGVVMCAPA